MGWIANILVLIGTFLIGEKKRSAFLWMAVGELLWVVVGMSRRELDITVICVIFTAMAVWNYIKWRS